MKNSNLNNMKNSNKGTITTLNLKTGSLFTDTILLIIDSRNFFSVFNLKFLPRISLLELFFLKFEIN